MPVESCQKDGRPGYRWGRAGTCYPYTSGDEDSRQAAHARAMRQGRAIEASRHARTGSALLGAVLAFLVIGLLGLCLYGTVLFGCRQVPEAPEGVYVCGEWVLIGPPPPVHPDAEGL